MQSKRFQIDTSIPLTVGLKWDELQGQSIDLDLQCVLLNELGQIEDAVFYNQLASKISKICLSEDSKGEKVGFDEFLNLDLLSCPFHIKYLVLLICSYKEQPLKLVESSELQVIQGPQILFTSSVGAFNDNQTLSCLPCLFEKSYDGKWSLVEINAGGIGHTFMESESLIKEGLVKAGFNQDLFLECQNWTGGKSFQLQKNQALIIPPSISTLMVGLGWDTTCDIDSSVLLFDREQNCVDEIYFGRKQNGNRSVVHGGDNLTGAGSGDDETIIIKLSEIPKEVHTIWAVITIFSNNYQFDDVKGAYCRLICKDTKSEFCRFNLSQNKDGVSNGNILCQITRCQQGTWSISPKGFYTRDTKRSNQVIPIVQKLLKNDFSMVKIIEFSNEQQHMNKAQQQAVVSFNYSIDIEKASGLGAFDSNGLSDPYIVFRVNGKKISKTEIKKKNLNPVYNHHISHKLSPGDTIEFKIYDYDFLASDDYMGSCFLDITPQFIQKQGKNQIEIKVQDKERHDNPKYKGNLYVSLTRQN